MEIPNIWRATALPVGCALMLDWGFGLDQMPCLENLWNKESGWNAKAANPSGAYGIPQALPGSKMSSAGADWKTNPEAFVKFVREHQCPSFLEYSEYPFFSADEIKKALQLKSAFTEMLDQMQ